VGANVIWLQGKLPFMQPAEPQTTSLQSTNQNIDAFLASVEKRALRMAEVATRNREDALELVQEAMFGLVKRYAKRPPNTWPPLFYRILQNGIRDWHRRSGLRSRFHHWFHADEDVQAIVEQVPDSHHADPFHHLELSDAGHCLMDALQALPLRQQQVFMLRVWEGLDVKATAKAMGCSVGSVKTHYSRARQSLQSSLKGYWP